MVNPGRFVSSLRFSQGDGSDTGRREHPAFLVFPTSTRETKVPKAKIRQQGSQPVGQSRDSTTWKLNYCAPASARSTRRTRGRIAVAYRSSSNIGNIGIICRSKRCTWVAGNALVNHAAPLFLFIE